MEISESRHAPRIVVYTGAGWRPCQLVKEFLSRAGHPFVERSVDEDDTAYDELLALGYRAVPVTVVGSTVVAGFDAEALRAALDG